MKLIASLGQLKFGLRNVIRGSQMKQPIPGAPLVIVIGFRVLRFWVWGFRILGSRV